jgi:hypothetical protein
MDATVNTQLIEEQRRRLTALMTTSETTAEKIRSFISTAMKEARDKVAAGIKFANDPRGAAQAVKRRVYQKYLGGDINIMASPGSHSQSTYEPPRKLQPHQRGGNRRLRSARTQQIMSYGPLDRAFILRMVNSGTKPRYANGSNGSWSKSGSNRTFFKLQEQGDYYRGSIGARNFFGRLGDPAVKSAVRRLSKMIDEEFNRQLGETS